MTNSLACSDCGRVPETCSFCGDVARYFIDANAVAQVPGTTAPVRRACTIHFCDNHAHSLLTDEARDRDLDVEVGLYCPNTDCATCDSWR